MSFLCVSAFLSFSFFRFLVKYFQLCICIVTILLPFVVNKAYHCRRFWQQSRTLLRHCCWCGPGLTIYLLCCLVLICNYKNKNWLQFLFIVKAAVLKQQISKFYPQIQRTEASDYIYFSQRPFINVKAIFCS